MIETWVAFTLLAAFMQAIRTAGQKKIAKYISPLATTFVRYLFGLPFAVLYLYFVGADQYQTLSLTKGQQYIFLLYSTAASVSQILATLWLVKVLSFRNFAVGTSFAKTEAMQTALLGAVFFSAYLSIIGWFAVFLGMLGILIVSLPSKGYPIDKRVVCYGVLSGVGFALTSLWVREASLALGPNFIFNAALTLVYMVILQTIICFFVLYIKQHQQLKLIKQHVKLAVFVGATSALGSIGWFTAMTFQNAALVKSLGQIEFVFSVLITYFFFNEKISKKEYLGMLFILMSVLVLLLN
ncbi:DMT family transporter [Gammaproteobacteria bacterium AS21]|jgi:drug/metabolite transporter (DMT)-like permease